MKYEMVRERPRAGWEMNAEQQLLWKELGGITLIVRAQRPSSKEISDAFVDRVDDLGIKITRIRENSKKGIIDVDTQDVDIELRRLHSVAIKAHTQLLQEQTPAERTENAKLISVLSRDSLSKTDVKKDIGRNLPSNQFIYAYACIFFFVASLVVILFMYH